jgi:BNR repeat-containing family member
VTWISLALAVLVGGIWQAPAGAARRPRVPVAPGLLAARSVSEIPRVALVGTWGPGSWCWFGDPRAVSVSGQYDQTFVGWIDWRGGIHVGAFDPGFGVTEQQTISYIYHDDHSSPAILVEPDKRLTVFWSAHNGRTMNYRTTLRPEDIAAWGPIEHVQAKVPGHLGFTYPNPVMLPAENNTLYLFWRGANWSADYATRTPDGQWSPARQLIRIQHERPYMKVDTNGSDTIALAFTDGHPRNVLTSVYYAAYRRGWLWTAGGRRIARIGHKPIRPSQADVVYNGRATGVGSWVWDVALGTDGHPVIVYATFPSDYDHEYWYARFDGRRWVSHFLTYSGPSISPTTIEYEYSGGITLDHGNPAIVYLSRKVGPSYQIERWATGDGGKHWRHRVVVRGGAVDNVRPVVPRGSHGGPMSLLWLRGDYISYTSYRTSIAYLP